jgi:hypothetical protein
MNRLIYSTCLSDTLTLPTIIFVEESSVFLLDLGYSLLNEAKFLLYLHMANDVPL